jgi:hypothetical protein
MTTGLGQFAVCARVRVVHRDETDGNAARRDQPPGHTHCVLVLCAKRAVQHGQCLFEKRDGLGVAGLQRVQVRQVTHRHSILRVLCALQLRVLNERERERERERESRE